MNQKVCTLLAGVGAFLVVGLLVVAMKYYTAPAPLNASRSAERAAARKEVREAAEKTLSNAEVTDVLKGNVRLKIDRFLSTSLPDRL